MKDEHLRILKTMHEATGRMDLTMLANAVNLSPNQAIADMQTLTREGFLHKVGNGYSLTDKAKNALKITTQIPSENAFNFYVGVDKPLGIKAETVEEFYRQIRQVYSDTLEFHLYRGDFENWIRFILKDDELATDFANIKAANLKGEELRKALLKAIDNKYGINEFL